jgi:hypothetical protein
MHSSTRHQACTTQITQRQACVTKATQHQTCTTNVGTPRRMRNQHAQTMRDIPRGAPHTTQYAQPARTHHARDVARMLFHHARTHLARDVARRCSASDCLTLCMLAARLHARTHGARSFALTHARNEIMCTHGGLSTLCMLEAHHQVYMGPRGGQRWRVREAGPDIFTRPTPATGKHSPAHAASHARTQRRRRRKRNRNRFPS